MRHSGARLYTLNVEPNHTAALFMRDFTSATYTHSGNGQMWLVPRKMRLAAACGASSACSVYETAARIGTFEAVRAAVRLRSASSVEKSAVSRIGCQKGDPGHHMRRCSETNPAEGETWYDVAYNIYPPRRSGCAHGCPE